MRDRSPLQIPGRELAVSGTKHGRAPERPMFRNDDRCARDALSIPARGHAGSEVPGSGHPPDPATHTPSRPATSLVPPTPAATPDQLLQGARACLRRGRTRDAATLMRLACDVAPLDVRCRALLAWLQMQCGEAPPAVVGEQLLELLTRAVRLYPDDLELRMYRAGAQQRLGRRAEALIDFSFVANADPCNTEAAGEMRRHGQRERLAGSGVFALEPGERGLAESAAATTRAPRRTTGRRAKGRADTPSPRRATRGPRGFGC
jgi:hypothetical protein